jgi:hypothetical protein
MVLLRFGLTPALSALQTGYRTWLFWLPLIRLDFSHEHFFTLITLTGLLGLFHRIRQHDLLLPVWFLFPFFLEPRNPAPLAMPALAMLAAIGLLEVILPGLMRAGWTADLDLSASAAGRTVLAFFLLYTLIDAFAGLNLTVRGLAVDDAEQSAALWARDHTPSGARFILMTYGDALNTPIQEWFPAISGRQNILTVQGYEWLPGGQFLARKQAFGQLQGCMFADPACMEAWAVANHLQFDYVYLSTELPDRQGVERVGQLLLQGLLNSSRYRRLYQAGDTYVFMHLP